MLPPGFSADAAPAAEQARLRPLLSTAQSVLRLRIGGCACALRLGGGSEAERILRRRYTALGLTRTRTIAALERHRQGAVPAGEPAVWRAALTRFVAEHARNAGPTLYGMGFGAEPSEALASIGRRTAVSAAVVRAAADTWLPEESVVEVTR